MNSAVTYLEETMAITEESAAFVRRTTDEIVVALEQFRGSYMSINVRSLRCLSGKPEGGFLRLVFQNGDAKPVRVGIAFGETDGKNKVERFGFNCQAWELYSHEPYSSGVNAADFDEAWRIICRVGTELDVAQVSISYGCQED